MSFTLTYNANNGSGDSATKVYTTPCRLEEGIFQTSGYELFSWNTMSDGSGTFYSKGQLISTDTEGEAIGGNLYAIWRISNAGQIKVINDGVVVDISDICTGITSVAGKNQPFSYITFQLIKNLFNDTTAGGYWETRKVLDPTLEKPELIQRKTIIEVDVYGIKGQWLYERVDEPQNTTWNVTAVVPAYALKTTTLDTLLNFTSRKDGNNLYVTFTRLGLGELLTTPVDVAHPEYERYYVDVPVEYRNSSDVYINTNKVRISFDNSTDCYVERVSGTGTSIVALILKYMGYNDSNGDTKRIYIDEGYIYDFSVGGTYGDIQSSYTQLEIESIKTLPKLPLKNTEYDALNVELRPDEYCYTIIQGIGYLTNRHAFFEKDAFFVDYQKVHGGTTTSIMQYEFTDPKTYGTAEKIKIDWGGTNEIISNYFVPELAGLSTNEDQGSQYILQTQKVISENYEATITISDTLSSTSGNDIKYMYRENVTTNPSEEYGKFVFDTDIRNFQTKMIALNHIVNWYKPGDCVSYNTVESKSQYTFTDIGSYTELLTYSAGDNGKPYTALVIGPADFRGKVYKGVDDGAGGWKWADEGDYTDESYATLTRDAVCRLYAMSSEVKDIQNGFSIYDVPLSEVVVNYPSCVTTYVWGNPYFMDEESQISTVDEITSDSTLDNTSDTQISDNYAAKIVVGNQSLGELTDERIDFTGLILEKNWDVDLYRLAGYKDGIVQAQFNTEGKITAGGGVVVLDEAGMKTYANPKDVKENNWVTMIDTQGAFRTGNMDGSGFGYVKLNTDGLNIYYDSGSYSQTQALNFRKKDTDFVTTKIYNVFDGTKATSYIETAKLSNETTNLIIRCEGSAGSTKTKSMKALSSTASLSFDGGSYYESSGSPDDILNYVVGREYIIKFKSTFFYEALSYLTITLDKDLTEYIGSSLHLLYKSFFTKVSNIEKMVCLVRIYQGDTIVKQETIPEGTTTMSIDISGLSKITKIVFGIDTVMGIVSGQTIFKLSDLHLVIDKPVSSAEIDMKPEESYPIQIPSNLLLGTNSSNRHEIHGYTTFIDGHNIQGQIMLSNTALMSLVDAICGNTTAVQQIKDSIDGL